MKTESTLATGLVLCLLCSAPAEADGEPARTRSMYVWWDALTMVNGRTDFGISDAGAQEELIRFCLDNEIGIGRLYFMASPEDSDEQSLTSFITSANRAGIEMYAVPRGRMQDAWIETFGRTGTCDNRPVLSWVDDILDYNLEHPGARFTGIQFDIEPHNARSNGRIVWRTRRPGLKNRVNRALASEYLRLLDSVRNKVVEAGGGLRFAVTIPAWYDLKKDKENYVLRYGGEKKPLAYHVMDRTDFVTLMNYVNGRTSESVRKAWKEISNEVAYGRCEVLFQTDRPGKDGPTRRTTLFNGGERKLRKIIRLVEKKYSSKGNFIGCGVHYYKHAFGSGLRGWPKHGS